MVPSVGPALRRGQQVDPLPRARHGEGRNPHAHPWFACLYGVLARVAEKGELGARRRALLASAEGRVLELGAGTGENFKHYPPQVTEVVAVEPDPHMRRQAARRIGEAAMAVELVDATGEDLPLEPSSFDTVVATLVLCSVDDPEQTLSELRRVLRPGGQLLFLEHVRARTEGLARWQDRLERPWMVVGGGCRPNRETGERHRGQRLQAQGPGDLRPAALAPPGPAPRPGRRRRRLTTAHRRTSPSGSRGGALRPRGREPAVAAAGFRHGSGAHHLTWSQPVWSVGSTWRVAWSIA